MNTFESFSFLCPYCEKPYRGFLHECPHCTAVLRPKSIIPEERWQAVQKLIRGLGFGK